MTFCKAMSVFSFIMASSSSSICTLVSLLGCVHCKAPRLPPMAFRMAASPCANLLKVSGAICSTGTTQLHTVCFSNQRQGSASFPSDTVGNSTPLVCSTHRSACQQVFMTQATPRTGRHAASNIYIVTIITGVSPNARYVLGVT